MRSGRVAEFLAAGGLDGILALGTTGEGISARPGRAPKRAAELFVETCRGRLDGRRPLRRADDRATLSRSPRHAAGRAPTPSP